MAASIAMITKITKLGQVDRFVWLVAVSVSAFGLVGCGSDTTGPVPTSAAQTVWTLTLNVHAANLALRAPYDTMQLTAIPRTPTGAPIADVALVQYSTADSAVTVSSTGLVTAHYTTTRAYVVARMTLGGITAVDTTVIQVVDAASAAPLTSLSIQPRPGGLSAPRAPLDACAQTNAFTPCPVVRVYATLATGNPATDTVCNGNVNGCTGLLVALTSSNPHVATIDRYGMIQPHHVGRVTFYATTLAYGMVKQDSLPFSIGYPNYLPILSVVVDSTQTPPILRDSLAAQLGTTPVYGVGAVFQVFNSAPGAVEVTLPAGVHFVDDSYDDDGYEMFVPGRTGSYDTVGTIKTHNGCAPYFKCKTFVQFDSAGTVSLQYKLLPSGMTGMSSSIIIKNYP